MSDDPESVVDFADVIAEVIRRFRRQGETVEDMVAELRLAADELELESGDDGEAA